MCAFRFPVTSAPKQKFNSRGFTTPEGDRFDSRLEYKRWLFLKDQQDKGNISNLQRQHKFVLIPAQYKTIERIGKRGYPLKSKKILLEHECSYFADFSYTVDGVLVVEDTKSPATKTPDYIIKRKLMLQVHGIRVEEIESASKPVLNYKI